MNSEDKSLLIGVIAVVALVATMLTIIAFVAAAGNTRYQQEQTQQVVACFEAGNSPIECNLLKQATRSS